jgi:phage terminase large subunit-like protein
MTRRRATSGELPPCDTAHGKCSERGDHLCRPRVAWVLGFFAELRHTKGRWARQRFVLADWQARDIVGPLLGTVRYDAAAGRYVRRYRIAWIELARKNGKSELLAGIALYLLCADDEAGAEVYGCACDRDQARKVFDVAARMVELLPPSDRRHLRIIQQAKRIVHQRTGSYYEIVAADAAGNLGHNPHGVIFDEVITQPDSGLWTAMRTGMGTRDQPLMIAVTTAGDDATSFARAEHDEMVRVAEDPDRAPHVFVYIRNCPADADPWDEANWYGPNPALGDFLSPDALRQEAIEARNEPSKENAFRQFRLNQWVQQATRWMPMHLWDRCAGELWLTPDWDRARLAGREAWAGFDLAAKFDLTAWCLLFPPEEPGGPVEMLWRFWLPENALSKLDKVNDGRFSRWARDGWLTVTEGAVLDYEQVYRDVAADAEAFALRGADCDEWSAYPVIQRIGSLCSLDVDAGEIAAYRNTYDRMSPGMAEVMALVQQGRLVHHGNPVARSCFEACEVRTAPYDPDLVRPSKPRRSTEGKRIDAVPAAAMACNAWTTRADLEPNVSAYEHDGGLMIV